MVERAILLETKLLTLIVSMISDLSSLLNWQQCLNSLVSYNLLRQLNIKHHSITRKHYAKITNLDDDELSFTISDSRF